MNLRVLEEENDVLPFLLLIQQCIDILCNVRLPSPLSVPVSLRPVDFDSQLMWEGRDVYTILAYRRDQFWYMTSETPETFNELLREVSPYFNVQRNCRIRPQNRLLLTLIWLRLYPTLSILSLIFDIPSMTISRTVEDTWMALWHALTPKIKWPSAGEWRQKYGKWPEMPHVVGAIDGTSHEILVPEIDQQLFYSGHRHFHCFHTQEVYMECSLCVTSQRTNLYNALQMSNKGQDQMSPRQSKQTIPDNFIHLHRQITELQKSTSEYCVTQMKNKLAASVQFFDLPFTTHHGRLSPFVNKCVELCWYMSIQEKPVMLVFDAEKGRSFRTDLYRLYTKSGTKCDFLVWPAMLLHDKGPILQKGVIQPE
ncbi:hypothetical protein FSP39_013878 [Pinctada imbricata]|uniref:Mitochondria-eating protein C-terminal domain-containing protein n=1 Tax=Pinctada imbricata TaxID=66713 RepID=A0AA88YMP1_PINIB|nr:hypothetical protein FSP39_013878 [Pinctada imbricata]